MPGQIQFMARSTNMKISIEIAYTNETVQKITSLEVDSGTTVKQAINISGITDKYPEIISGQYQFGVYGKKVSEDAVLMNFDRIEIYRPLKISPKEARRLRAKMADEKN